TGLLTKPVRKMALLEALAKYGTGNGRRIRIAVDPELRDIAPGYLEKRKLEVSTCYGELAAGNLESLRAIGHKMKGTGTGYGFPFLTEIGGKIEVAAR